MDPYVAIQLVCLVLLLCLSAFFSSAETALTTVNLLRIQTKAEEGDQRAARVIQVTENKSKMLKGNVYQSSL